MIKILEHYNWLVNDSPPNRTVFNYKLKNYSHFVEIVKSFDSAFDTETYIIHDTISKVNDNITKIPFIPKDKRLFSDCYYCDIEKWIKYVFKNSNFIITSDVKNSDRLAKLNRLGVLLKDIKSNKLIKYPMGLHCIPNYNAIHPGLTRLLISGIYDKPIYFILTDYTKKAKQNYPMFDFYKPEEINNMNIETCELIFGNMWNRGVSNPLVFFNSNNSSIIDNKKLQKQYPNFVFKEVDEWSLNDPTTTSKNFLLKDDKFYIDNECILLKRSNVWEFNHT
tara:strand:- start:767 stop:1603 length:837 start_codon:yes stop_codon:yes gene_type:complete